MHLTCNQLMILLDIYRGTLEAYRHLNTFQHDINTLLLLNLVKAQSQALEPPHLSSSGRSIHYKISYYLTELGTKRAIQAIEPAQPNFTDITSDSTMLDKFSVLNSI